MKHSPKSRQYRSIDLSMQAATIAAVMNAARLAGLALRATQAQPPEPALDLKAMCDIRTYDRRVDARRTRVFGHKGTPHRDNNWS